MNAFSNIRGLIALACCVWLTLSAQADELKLNTQDFPPFSFLVDGVVAGPGAEVIKQVCKEANIACTLNLLPWRRAQKEVEDGQAQGLFLVGWNEERAKLFHFSPPILKTAYGFFVHADDPLQYQKPFDLVGYAVGVYGPSNTSKSLEKFRDQMLKESLRPVTIDMRPDDESGFLKLDGNRIQAVFSNRDVGMAMIAKLGLKNIRYAGNVESLNYFVALSKNGVDKSLADQFNKAFRKLHQDGTVGKILSAYHMKDVPQKAWDEK